jgi:hypothetical protein
MARLIVLRIEDDEEADWLTDPTNFSELLQSAMLYQVTIEMMVQTPTMFCDCFQRPKAWRRGEKRGWWVHSECGRPSVAWGSNPRAVIGEAIDMLEKETPRNTQERLQEINHDND